MSVLFLCFNGKESVAILPIANPDQINAYEYGQNVLKGVAGKGKAVKHPPQFERALSLSGQKRSTLFISGTASIIGQDTIGIGDVERQTVVTIDNIKKLIEQKRLAQNIPYVDKDPGKLLLIRVYVKSQNDFKKVKAIRTERFPEVPAVYIESDICRDNLLVELKANY